MIDVWFSIVSLILLAPILAAVAIAVKLTSKGPVFDRQERIGLNREKIYVCRFRTMTPHRGPQQSEGFHDESDLRVTRVGKFLRSTSIDELPQFLNVLKGDMSIVGPRPMPKWIYEEYSQEQLAYDWETLRVSVRPGITCLWQIQRYGEHSFQNLAKLDAQYAEQVSLLLDMKILASTIPAALRSELDLDSKYVSEQSVRLDTKIFAEYLRSIFLRVITSHSEEQVS